MDEVEAPQDRHFMREDVPDIHRVIEEEERYGVAKPLRAADPLRDAPALLADAHRQRIDQRPLKGIDDGYAARAHDQVADGAPWLLLTLLPKRLSLFRDEQDDGGAGHDSPSREGERPAGLEAVFLLQASGRHAALRQVLTPSTALAGQ